MKRSSAVLLTLLILVVLLVNSADFLFRQSYYEVWDSAANSLSVLRAKHFAQLYGPYSRWKFHHPGPALFYIQALGEWVFHDLLHWVKTPFPGQVIGHGIVMCCFFVAALMIFANGLPPGRARWWFLCGALVLAILHFTAMSGMPSYDVLRGPTAFLSPWSAHALVLPFLCLLTAGASVASGRSEDLPVLALASGYLLELHVAEPMFVGPVFALAYAGLLWHGHRQAAARGGYPGPSSLGERLRRVPGAAWRASPRAHGVAALILAFFALPFILDAGRGSGSNLAAIWQHLRAHHEHKPFEQAWFYFLQFGAYVPYTPVGNEFKAYDHAGMVAYLHAHRALYGAWSVAALLAAWALLAGGRAGGAEEGFSTSAGPLPPVLAARRFRAWAAVFLLLALGLTLRWNVMQDGQMYYFNSWFTFAIYYFGALIALAVVCAGLRGLPSVSGAGNAVGGQPVLRERVAGIVLVIAVAGWWSPGLRLADPDPGATRAMHADILRAERSTPGADTGGKEAAITMLAFQYEAAPTAVAVALQLKRDGWSVVTQEQWRHFIGEDDCWDELPEKTIGESRLRLWRVVHRGSVTDGTPETDLPVTTAPYVCGYFGQADDVVVRSSIPVLGSLASGDASIRFVPGGNAPEYAVDGWSSPEPWGTWSDGLHTLLWFRPPAAVDARDTVEITLAGLVPLLDPPLGLTRQRMQVYFDGQPLGPEKQLTGIVESLTYRVPAALWNHGAASSNPDNRLELDFPDATSPAALDPTGLNVDTRLLGVGLREVRFRVVPPPEPVATAGHS